MGMTMTKKSNKLTDFTASKDLPDPGFPDPKTEALSGIKRESVSNSDRAYSKTIQSILLRFSRETSAHGCANVVSSNRNIFVRAVWCLLVLTMLGCVLFTLYFMLIAYNKFPVNTVTKVTARTELPFPGITICNINEVDIDEAPVDGALFRQFKEQIGLGYEQVNYSDPAVRTLLDTPIDVVVNSSWCDCDKLLVSCFLNGDLQHCPSLFGSVQDTHTRCATLKTGTSSLQSMLYAGPNSGLRLYLNVHQKGYAVGESVAAGVKLYIHEPDHFPDFQNSGMLISPGTTTFVAITPIQYEFLPEPYMAYEQEACVEVEGLAAGSSQDRLRLGDHYTYAACTMRCAVDKVARLCGCRGVLNEEDSALPVCTVEQFYTCYERKLSQTYFNVSASSDCGCQRPCRFMEYETQLSSAFFPSEQAQNAHVKAGTLPSNSIRENYLEVRIFLAKLSLQEMIHEPVYTYTTIMGTVGGQMGLFMGASLLTVGELLELLFLLLCSLVYRLAYRRGHTSRGRIVPVKPTPTPPQQPLSLTKPDNSTLS